MPSYPKNYPFYSWMPKPLGIIILLFFFLPILTVGGVYSVNSTEMMSGLGIISEHIQFANFVTSIGMAAFAPFLYQLVCVRREKMMCIVGFAFMYIFSYICAKTDSVFLLALCSLLTGFLRMVLMMVNLFTLIWYAGGMEATRNITPGLEPKDTAGWNKLDIERCVSQPAVYLFFMILGQSGTALTAWLSFEYEWKYVYYFMMGILLISILLLFITMPNYKFPGRFPINFRKFGNVTAFCISLTCLTYVLVYGKVLDWYDDESIRWATAVSILFAGIFLYMDVTRRSPYVLLDAFKLRTIRMGALLYLLLMVINSSAMFVNVFAGVGMHLDNLQNASLGNWCMVGYAIGAVIAMVLGGKGLHFKYLFAMGFFFLSLSAVFMYFVVALILFSPVMLITAIVIKVTSPGPLIFKQERIGLKNKPFYMYKFRSMVVQEDTDEKKEWTTKNDPRVTPVGRFIRRTSIDELPQLFNVLMGTMSLVGPRPERPQFVDKFKEEIPRYMIKHQVRPGLTGWAQVNGYRGDTSIRKRIEYDLYYIENWTIGFDFKIILLTFFKGFINKNAY